MSQRVTFSISGEVVPSAAEVQDVLREHFPQGKVHMCAEADREAERLTAQLHQAQRMETIGQLAGGVAHDFNNLLTAILGNAELLQGMLQPEDPARGPLGMIEKAAQQAASVTRALLTLGRDAGSERRVVNLSRATEDACRLLRRLLPAAIGLKTETACEPPIWVEADPTQIQQVVINIAINARDAMPEGGRLLVRVGAAPAELMAEGGLEGDEGALLEISDTGVGMAPEVQEHLFEPFFTTKPRGAGTGLGLSIVHSVVANHGGRVLVRSTPGQGSTFAVLLPGVSPVQGVAGAEASVVAPRGNGELLLVAEDDESARGVMRDALKSLGYRVLTTADGAELLSCYERFRDDVRMLVVDADLPQRSGVDCVRDLRETGDQIPVLLTTGNIELAPVGVEGGETGLLRKPFGMTALACRVRSMLGSAPAEPDRPEPPIVPFVDSISRLGSQTWCREPREVRLDAMEST